jgi:hypothetical protein
MSVSNDRCLRHPDSGRSDDARRPGLCDERRLDRASGPPIEAYDYPKTRCVAGFISIPPLNFISGAISRCNGTLAFQNQFCSLAAAGVFEERICDRVGATMELGVWPGDLKPASVDGGEDGFLPREVQLVDSGGAGQRVAGLFAACRYDSRRGADPNTNVNPGTHAGGRPRRIASMLFIDADARMSCMVEGIPSSLEHADCPSIGVEPS